MAYRAKTGDMWEIGFDPAVLKSTEVVEKKLANMGYTPHVVKWIASTRTKAGLFHAHSTKRAKRGKRGNLAVTLIAQRKTELRNVVVTLAGKALAKPVKLEVGTVSKQKLLQLPFDTKKELEKGVHHLRLGVRGVSRGAKERDVELELRVRVTVN